MGITLRCVIVVIVLAWCVAVNNADSDPNSNQNTVVITNGLSNNKKLKVHCKSKDDDLGFHALRYLERYHFNFEDNFFGTTLFWCHLWQGRNYEHHQSFVAYKAKFMPRNNQLYAWEGRDDGVYFGKNEHLPAFMYAWDVPHK